METREKMLGKRTALLGAALLALGASVGVDFASITDQACAADRGISPWQSRSVQNPHENPVDAQQGKINAEQAKLDSQQSKIKSGQMKIDSQQMKYRNPQSVQQKLNQGQENAWGDPHVDQSLRR